MKRDAGSLHRNGAVKVPGVGAPGARDRPERRDVRRSEHTGYDPLRREGMGMVGEGASGVRILLLIGRTACPPIGVVCPRISVRSAIETRVRAMNKGT
jgi:hypothetical protein